MDKSKKIVAFGIGVIAVGGLAWFVMSNKKDKSPLRQGGPDYVPGPMPGPMPLPVDDFSPSDYGVKVGVKNSSGLGTYKWYAVDSRDRKRFNASAEIGTQAMINGTMPCTINNFWVDSNGEKGAFKCEELEDGMYEIPGGSRLEY